MGIDDLKFEVGEDIKALIPEEKLTVRLQEFAHLDSNQDGKIGINEFLDFFMEKEKNLLTRRFNALDNNKDGFIELEEFVVGAEPYFQILKKFRELDLDRDGLLSIQEAINIADQLVLPLNSEQIRAIISEVDRDGDGKVTYYEYLGAIAHVGFQ